MRYYVTYKIDARYEVFVNAETIEEAKEKAMEKYYWGADFGDCHDVDGEQIYVEDENGNILWEK